MPTEPLWKVAEVARRLRMSRDTVYGLIRCGALPGTSRSGARRGFRVPESAIRHYLTQNEHAPAGGDQPGRANTEETEQ